MELTFRMAPRPAPTRSGRSACVSRVSDLIFTSIIAFTRAQSLPSKSPLVADAGVIHQQSHTLATRRERRDERLYLHFVAQIRGMAMDRQSGPIQLAFQRFQPIQTPRHQDQRARVRRKLPHKFQSNP